MFNILEASTRNHLLAVLPPDVLKEMEPCVQCVELKAGEAVFEAGSVLRHAYFPVSTVVSLFSPLQSGVGAEVAVVGREGVVGVGTFMGGGVALCRPVVQHTGLAWRISASDMADLSNEHGPLMAALLRYVKVLFLQMAQTSACRTHHCLSAQLCCWLLQHFDRQVGDEMRVTHERIAIMLGVRREGVSEAAFRLQREGMIRYHRGQIHVVDRCKLEEHSCECYGTVLKAYQQLRSSETA